MKLIVKFALKIIALSATQTIICMRTILVSQNAMRLVVNIIILKILYRIVKVKSLILFSWYLHLSLNRKKKNYQKELNQKSFQNLSLK